MTQKHTSAFKAVPERNAARLDIVNEWYEEKRKIDNCPANLWRVHDKLYDLSR